MSHTQPKIIYVTAWKKDKTASLVEQAVLAGFRAIDTACQPKHYDERGVGEALARLIARGLDRKSLFVQTKFTPIGGQDPARVPYDRRASLATQVAQSFRMSQQNLGMEYVDSLVLHSPLAHHEELMEVWEAMEAIAKDGGAKKLGISNCYDLTLLQRLHLEAKVKPTIVQNRLYNQTGYDNELRQWCLQHQITYQSFWTLTANPHILTSHAVESIAKLHGKTSAQVFFRYLTQRGVDPMSGTSSLEHMKEDLDSFTFTLTDLELEAIDELLV